MSLVKNKRVAITKLKFLIYGGSIMGRKIIKDGGDNPVMIDLSVRGNSGDKNSPVIGVPSIGTPSIGTPTIGTPALQAGGQTSKQQPKH